MGENTDNVDNARMPALEPFVAEIVSSYVRNNHVTPAELAIVSTPSISRSQRSEDHPRQPHPCQSPGRQRESTWFAWTAVGEDRPSTAIFKLGMA